MPFSPSLFHQKLIPPPTTPLCLSKNLFPSTKSFPTLRLHHFPSLSSTHVTIKSAEYRRSGSIVLADTQTCGKGRIEGREWVSERGGLFFSHGMGFGVSSNRMDVAVKEVFRYRMMVAVALVQAMRDVFSGSLKEMSEGSSEIQGLKKVKHASSGDSSGTRNKSDDLKDNGERKTRPTTDARLLLKWPNDVYYVTNDAMYKVAGMLMDNEFITVHDSDSEPFSVMSFVGIGVNVNQTSIEGCNQSVTSLKAILGRDVQIEALLAAYFNHLRRLMTSVTQDAELKRLYREAMGMDDEHEYMVTVLPQRVEHQASGYAAKVVDVTMEGNLLVQPEGSSKPVELTSEEVSLRLKRKDG